MNIDTMPAGREMDALVAEKVMELPCQCIPGQVIGYACHIHDPKPYSSGEITFAWKAVEKLKDWCLQCWHGGDDWQVKFISLNEEKQASADTAPLAICRAALKAVGA